MKVLCLHGSHQTSEVFRSRLGKLPSKLHRLLGSSCHFLEAPLELPLRPGDQAATRCWWDSSRDPQKALLAVASCWASHGPFQCVLGFSQGASLAALLAASAEKFPQLKCVIMAGGSTPASLVDVSPVRVPSLHIIGSRDSVVSEQDEALARVFQEARVLRHTGGHCFPGTAECHDACVEFLRELSAQTPLARSDQGAAEQRQEMDALRFIYWDQMTVLREGAAREGDACGQFQVALQGAKLLVCYPGDYPEERALFSLVEPTSLSAAQQESLLSAVALCAGQDPGEPSVFAGISAAEEWLQTQQQQEEEEEQEREEQRMVEAATQEACLWVAQNPSGSAAPGGRGVRRLVVGLVGKPSAGKSTFFNCVTRLQQMAKVSPHPFTTIEPNFGAGWWASNDALDSGAGGATQHGRDAPGRRLLPLLIKDVAGLIPGAYRGHGKGNRFLNDLCDADVLIHVVDVSGRADRNGVEAGPQGASTAQQDVAWVREELHRWIYGNVAAKWDSVLRLSASCSAARDRVCALFSGYQGSPGALTSAASRARLDLSMPHSWTRLDLHRLVAHFLSARFPMVLALNKCDALVDDTSGKIEAARQAASRQGYTSVACSARTESDLLRLASEGVLQYQQGAAEAPGVPCASSEMLLRLGGTRVLHCVSQAVALLRPVLVYPVGASPRHRECLQALPGVTVYDVYEALKRGALDEYRIEGDFIRAEGTSLQAAGETRDKIPLRQLGRDARVDDSVCVLKILTNRKIVRSIGCKHWWWAANFSCARGEMNSAILQHDDGVLCVSFNHVGSYIITGGQDRLVKIWNSDNYSLVATFSAHRWPVRDVVCNRAWNLEAPIFFTHPALPKDSSSLVSCGEDKSVLVWDVMKQQVTRRLQSHVMAVNSVAFNGSLQSVVVSGGADNFVHCWDMRSRNSRPIQSFNDATDGITSVKASDDVIYAASIDGHLRAYDVRAGKLRVDAINAAITSMALAATGDIVLVSSLDDALRLLDTERGVLLNEFTGHSNNKYKTGCAISNDASVVCAGSEDHSVFVWDLLDGNVKHKCEGHTNVVTSVAIAPRQKIIASSSTDRTVRLWMY